MASSLGIYNPFLYRGYVYDYETGHYYIQNRYYNPKICRFISADSISYLGADGTITSHNLFAYCGNNPICYLYSDAINGYFNGLMSKNNESSVYNTSGFNGLANIIDTVSTFQGIYASVSSLATHTVYFSQNLQVFSDDLIMIGASIKTGVLTFNQFTWGLGQADVFGITLGVGFDIYDSIQRGVSPGGVILGASLTAVKSAGLFYLNKGTLYGATAIGSSFGPVGAVAGFVVGGIICIVVDIFASNWADDLIDLLAK